MLISEIASDPNETVAELRVLAKTFPNTWRKMVAHLVGKQSKLKYAGFDIYDASGYGPAIDGLTHAVKQEMGEEKLQSEVTITILGKQFHAELPIKDANLVRVFYEVKGDSIMLGYDAWLDEQSFSDAFDGFFEERTGEEFDYDNDEHREVFEEAAKDFNSRGMTGLLISGSYDGMKPMIGVELEAPKGFFKGIEPMLDRMDLIPL